MFMSLDIQSIYKTVLPIKNVVQLTYKVSEIEQRKYIAEMIDFITPDQDPKILLMITKIYIHFVSFGASEDVKDDAFTSMMILKSFSIKQQLDVMQDLLFSFYFHLLYSRSLTTAQKKETTLEFAEFGQSENTKILIRFICFYFDVQGNKEFNLFEHDPKDISNVIIANLCKAFLRIIQEDTTTFPALKPEVPALTLDAIQQRFYNQLVYGNWGIQAIPYDSERLRILLDCLSDCSRSNLQSAKKALIKCIEFLYHQVHSAESKDNADYLIRLSEDIQYAIEKIEAIDLGKLRPQWEKLAKKIVEKGY